jgi:ubiquinone/menaquinone biosynthesis C-methylase UbiE
MRNNINHSENKEQYSPGYGKELIQSFQQRSIIREAAFFVPYLRNDMTLLDCGCGPGTITSGLAQLLTHGEVIAIDIEPGQIEQAQAYALEKGITNIQFKTSSIYNLPFPNSQFDAVFAHAVFQHLNDPLSALEEIKRVLKPGGIVGLRDDDQGSLLLAPETPQMEKVIVLLKQFMRHSGGNPSVGRKHRELLRKAGFINTQAFASCEYDGNYDSTNKRGTLAAKLIEHMTNIAIDQGWANANEMKELELASKQWGEDPDAFDAIIWCEAIGWRKE